MDFLSELLVPHDFSCECDILLLFQSPKNCGPVKLTICKEPSLPPIISSVHYLFGPSVQRERIDWAILSIGEEELWARSSEIHIGKGHNMEGSGGV